MTTVPTKEDYFNYAYHRLTNALPDKPWIRAFKKINTNLKKQASIDVLADNLMSYGIDLWENRSSRALDDYERRVMAEALYYCEKFLELNDSMTLGRRAGSISKFRAAFERPSEMRSLVFETFMFHALKYKGYGVECKDDDVGKETYDFLVTNKDLKLQVECKSFAYDKGLHITAGDAQDLAARILGRGLNLHRSPEGEMCFLTVEMRRNIARSRDGKESLVDSICQSLNDEFNQQDEGFKLHLERVNDVKKISDTDGWLDISRQGGGSELACMVTAPNGSRSRICLRVTAGTTDSFWREFEKICKFAAKEQLNCERPSYIAIHVSNIEVLDKITKDDRFYSKMKNVFRQRHIVSMIVVSNVGVCEQEAFPHFYVAPKIEEFHNGKTIFPSVGKLIDS